MKNIKMSFILLFSFFSFTYTGICTSFDKACDVIQSDIKTAKEELLSLRNIISKERKQLSDSLEEKQAEIIKLRQEYKQLSSEKYRTEENFILLKEEASKSEEDIRFMVSLLTEYFREMRKRMALGEEIAYENEINYISDILNGNDFEVLQKLEKFLLLVDKRNQNSIGGYLINGSALDKEGTLLDGKWIFTGPLSYFFSDKKNAAGLIGITENSIKPRIVFETSINEMNKIADGKNGLLPIDVTLGGALKVKEIEKTWIENIKAGGIIMIPILILGLCCFLIAVWKFFTLNKLMIPEDKTINEIVKLINENKKDEALNKVKSLAVPFSSVFEEGIEHSQTEKEYLEEIMHERILFQIPYLEKGLSFIAVSAAASPLLGLLGTVTGMMHTFNLVTVFGTGKADLLSGGISEALITTEYGLIVAIPSLLIHAFLSRKVKIIIHMLEQKSLVFINGIFSKYNKKDV